MATLRREWPLALTSGFVAGMMLLSPRVKEMTGSPAITLAMLVALCAVILLGAVAIVRHAEVLAHRLGEPGGTLLLTMAITGLEAAMVGLVMSTGEEKPTLARDTMFAVAMLVLNGFLGVALLLGGVRHRLQAFNQESANAFLAMIIPLATLSLVLPNFTRATVGPTLSSFQMLFLSVTSVGVYAIFLLVQNRWHRDFFVHDSDEEPHPPERGPGESSATTGWHVGLLGLYGVSVVLLAKQMSAPLDAAVLGLGAPPALAGFIVALLVLTPESIAAIRAARENQMQRSVNILLGSVLASIGLTVPLVIGVALTTGRSLVLGLAPAEMILLALTLAVSMLTFARPRTNMLAGSIHLVLFAAALMLVFDA